MGTPVFSPHFDDGAIHEIDFGLALGENILQHGGTMFAGSVGSFLHQRARIAVQFDAESFGDGFAFGDQIVEQLAGGREASGRAVMQAE